MYNTAIIKLLLWKNFLVSLLLQALNEVSQSNIFLVYFLYTWSSKVNYIFIISELAFCSLNSILIGSFSSSSFSSKLLQLYLIKVLATGRPVAKLFFYEIYKTLCVFTALLLQDQTILIWLPSPKLIYELFLIYS